MTQGRRLAHVYLPPPTSTNKQEVGTQIGAAIENNGIVIFVSSDNIAYQAKELGKICLRL